MCAAASVSSLGQWGIPILSPQAKTVFVHDVAGMPFKLDCGYYVRGTENVAETFPPYKGQPAEMYVKAWVCSTVNAFLRRPPALHTPASAKAAWAILVLTHESIHLSPYAGHHDEALTECRALQLVKPVTEALLRGNDDYAAEIGREALAAHAKLIATYPKYGNADCVDGGSLDIHPDSNDWPN